MFRLVPAAGSTQRDIDSNVAVRKKTSEVLCRSSWIHFYLQAAGGGTERMGQNMNSGPRIGSFPEQVHYTWLGAAGVVSSYGFRSTFTDNQTEKGEKNGVRGEQTQRFCAVGLSHLGREAGVKGLGVGPFLSTTIQNRKLNMPGAQLVERINGDGWSVKVGCHGHV